MKVAFASDLHGQVPSWGGACDLLVVAGDVCNGKDHFQQARQLREGFYPWATQFPACVWVGGNHDYLPMRAPGLFPMGPDSVRYLQDEGCEIAGLKIYGTPWCLPWGSGAFLADEADLDRAFVRIPEGLDILVTHGPPKGYGDWTSKGTSEGSYALLAAIDRAKPRVVCVGHMHPGRGIYRRGETLLVNAALAGMSKEKTLVHEPYVLDWEDLDGYAIDEPRVRAVPRG